jgi:hypothetical protein
MQDKSMNRSQRARSARLIALFAAAVAWWASGCASSSLDGEADTRAQDTGGADTSTDTEDAATDEDATTTDDTSGGDDALTNGDGETTSGDTSGGDTSGGDTSGSSGVCVPNRDGVITRAEVPIASGLRGNFRVASDATISLTAQDGVWDLTAALDAGKDVTSHLYDPSGEWFGELFPDATYYAKLSEGSDLQGIFQATDDALLLLGVASPTESVSATRLSYSPPVPVLQFPLQVGAAWSVETTVSGNFNGFPISYTETYASTVDATGTLKIPFARGQGIETLRVSTAMTRGVWTFVFPYYYVTDLQSVAFVAECFGTVAAATSQEGEASAEFTDAAEVRGLAP